jgi:hypothetical protein
METTTKTTAAHELLSKMVEKAIIPHAEEIARIAIDGGVAVVLYQPDATARRIGRELGWDKYNAPVIRLSQEHAARLATADRATAKWLARTSGVRVFVFMHGGTLLLNFGDQGWSLEAGSTDVELKATRN